MKKVLVLIVSIAALTSCGKNYDCVCTATDSANDDTFLLENYKEEDATAKCLEFSNSGVVDGWSCELK